MVFENEELRLRTINISADVERGQSDIRKLRRENELLRREIWTLRDEYDRLDKLLQDHRAPANSKSNLNNDELCDDSSENTTDSCDVCTEIENNNESEENVENSKMAENANRKISPQITPTTPTRHNVSFKLLTPVSEDKQITAEGGSSSSTTQSDDIHTDNTPPHTCWMENKLATNQQVFASLQEQSLNYSLLPSPLHSAFSHNSNLMNNLPINTFQKGGNLEDLLSDIEHLSRDIYHMQLQNSRKISKSNDTINERPDIMTNSVSMASLRGPDGTPQRTRKPFRSEVSLVLMQPNLTNPRTTPPENHPPIGFEYFQPSTYFNALETKLHKSSPSSDVIKTPPITNSKVRKQFVKSPSYSMDDDFLKPNQNSQQQHSKDTLDMKRRSLDTIKESLTPCDEANQLNEENNLSNVEKPRKKSHGPTFFFRRRKPEKIKDNFDGFENDFMTSPSSVLKPISFRGTNNSRVARKNPAKDISQSAATRYQRKMSMMDSFKGHKKAGRLSIDSNMVADGEESAVSLLESSSRESSESFRSRKMSSSSDSKKSSDKIPWCACWGNGCY